MSIGSLLEANQIIPPFTGEIASGISSWGTSYLPNRDVVTSALGPWETPYSFLTYKL